ncbi:hypothetical protein P389DRAFT_174128 [Cystobasidium minutum MCA 4210]|uniref:uncharacterized protein n=1 Tax=Cystobasidium minutum MCA 4210 TaxID=1397322 RepID=UPI0034CD1E56|eukprot:jgi/Rhomi1/174128/fgenesh1_kg.7_\
MICGAWVSRLWLLGSCLLCSEMLLLQTLDKDRSTTSACLYVYVLIGAVKLPAQSDSLDLLMPSIQLRVFQSLSCNLYAQSELMVCGSGSSERGRVKHPCALMALDDEEQKRE